MPREWRTTDEGWETLEQRDGVPDVVLTRSKGADMWRAKLRTARVPFYFETAKEARDYFDRTG